jgi:hypothetical protein
MRLIRAVYRLWLGRAAIRDLQRARFYFARADDRLERSRLLAPRMGTVVPLIGPRH